ncbi:MAG: type II toxin-antitoxin system HicB family antitoxin [Chloroflexota bacterium]
MSEQIRQPRYSMVIEWSDEDQVYIVSFPEWSDLAYTYGATYAEAVTQGQEVIDLLIESALAHGESLPQPSVFGARKASA